MDVRCLSNHALEGLVKWRNPPHANQAEKVGKIIATELSLALLTLTAVVETVAYGILLVGSIVLLPYNYKPVEFFASLFVSSSLTVGLSIVGLGHNLARDKISDVIFQKRPIVNPPLNPLNPAPGFNQAPAQMPNQVPANHQQQMPNPMPAFQQPNPTLFTRPNPAPRHTSIPRYTASNPLSFSYYHSLNTGGNSNVNLAGGLPGVPSRSNGNRPLQTEQQYQADLERALRNSENDYAPKVKANIVEEGAKFILKDILQNETEETLDNFDAVYGDVIPYVKDKGIYQYAYGTRANDSLPEFFTAETNEKIKTARERELSPEIRKILADSFANFENYSKAKNQVSNTEIKAIFQEIFDIRALEMSKHFEKECWGRAARIKNSTV